MKKPTSNRLLWIISFFVITLFWLLLGSSIINIYSNVSFNLDKNNIFINSELYKYIGANLPFLSMWLGFYFAFKYINNIKFKSLINMDGIIDNTLFIKVFLFSFAFLVSAVLIGSFLNLYNLEFIKDKTVQRLLIIPFTLILTPLQVIGEEILFRAIIVKIFIGDYDTFKNRKNALFLSLLISILVGMVFVIPHLSNPEVNSYFIKAITYYFVFGSLATLSILFTSGLEIAIAIHLANNFVVTFFSTYENSALSSVPLFIKRNESPFATYFEIVCLIFLFIIIGYTQKSKIKEYLKVKG